MTNKSQNTKPKYKSSKTKTSQITRISAKTPEDKIGTKIFQIIIAILVPLGGGFLISLLTRDAMGQFNSFKQPPLAPPAWLFPVAWTILYILMGFASYLIYRQYKTSKKAERIAAKSVLALYVVQLILNFAWTPIFFNLGQFWLALVVLLAMWLAEILILAKARKISRPAFYCLIPYLLWTTFAAYLNISIALLN
jgi:tryptophan-rich sensory protein